MTLEPNLLKIWNKEKNKDVDPFLLSSCSQKKVWWKCGNGHEWERSIYAIRRNPTCPKCKQEFIINRKVEKAERKRIQRKEKNIKKLEKESLEYKYPWLAGQWNYEKNEGLLPSQVTGGCNKKVWWRCKNGHEWEAQINSRTRGCNCPICSCRKIQKGYNDLETLRPEMLKQWDFEKNKDVDITKVGPKSKLRVWWKCEDNHQWKEAINSRCNNILCPVCYNMHGTSFPEQSVYYYIKQVYPSAINRYKEKRKYEIDIYIPEIKLGIEYDGIYYHNTKEARRKELEKEKLLRERNINIIRIKEDKVKYRKPTLKGNIIYYKIGNYENLSGVIRKLFEIIKVKDKVKIDVNRDIYKIIESYSKVKLEESLVCLAPHLLKEWNTERNFPLRPEKLTARSDRKVWWKCEKGHEWKTSPNKRYLDKTNCPICANKKVLAGFNDLATINPELAKQWHPTKNGDLKPTQFTICSGKKVWWKCEKGHEWEATIARRKERGCKYCNKKALIKGENDMVSARPELLNEWDYEKNKGINPEEMFRGSEKRVWWRCKKGHSWKTLISDRVRRNKLSCLF